MKMLMKCRVHSWARDRRNGRSPTTSFAFKYCPANVWLVSLDSSLYCDSASQRWRHHLFGIDLMDKRMRFFQNSPIYLCQIRVRFNNSVSSQTLLLTHRSRLRVIMVTTLSSSSKRFWSVDESRERKDDVSAARNTWQKIHGSNGGFILTTCNFVSHRSRHKPGPSLRRRGGILRGFRNIFWSRPGYAWTLKVAPSCLRNIKAIHIYRELDTVST